MTNECEISCSKYVQQKYGSMAIVAQSLAVTAQSLLFMSLGMNLAIPTIVLREVYHQSNGEFLITTTEASWYGSLLYLVQPVVSIISGIVQEKFGKKCCMFLSNVPDLVGWILLYYARCPLMLCMSSTLKGITAGFGSGSTSSYVGEITEPRLRGSLGSLGTMAIATGTLLIYVLGSFFDWRTIALLCTMCPLFCMCLLVFIPESPIWLIARGECEKAERAMCWLRGWVKPEIIKEEFLELIRYDKVSGTLLGKIDNDDEGFFAKLAQFKDPSVYRPMRLVLISFSMAFLSGIFPARPFMTKIMTEIELFDNQNEILVLLAVLTCLGSSILMAVIHRTGKRFLILSTLSINAILLILFGIYIKAVKNNYIGPLHWIPLTILCSIFFFGSCGISYISWTLLLEVFPNKSRGIATSACTGLTYILFFVSTKIYLSIEIALGLGYIMIIFGFLCFVGLIYLYVYLPETENRTLLEIEEFFTSNSKGYNKT